MNRGNRRHVPAPQSPRSRSGGPRARSRAVRTAASALVIAAVALGLVLWQSARDSGRAAPLRSLPLAPASTLGALSPAPDPGPLGPEAVPIPAAPTLARADAPASGHSVDGISAAAAEQLAFHIHAHLTIFVAGVPRQIPYGVGIAPPLEVESTPRGPFAAGGAAFFWLHTHAADGIIHIESPVERTYTLGNFFDVWNQPLGPERVGLASGHVTAFFNGRRYLGSPRGIPLIAHAQIQLDVGKPLVAPESIQFPPGL
jgi:hypothetical protein